jgi:monolysocardiolipin acyltransferase
MLKDLHEKVQQGEWVHIFPEGKIEQREGEKGMLSIDVLVYFMHILWYDIALGGRPAGPERDRIGRLKWGVGKLIARAEQRPVVIPFYHVNMQKVRSEIAGIMNGSEKILI